MAGRLPEVLCCDARQGTANPPCRSGVDLRLRLAEYGGRFINA